MACPPTGKLARSAPPNPQELAAASDKHMLATDLQNQHAHAASTNHALLASVNHGLPAIAAATVAGQLTGRGMVASKGYGALVKSPNALKTSTLPGGVKQMQPVPYNAARVTG